MIVASHTGRTGVGALVAAAVLATTRIMDPGRRFAQLMPAAGLVAAGLAPLAGIALGWLVCLALAPLPDHALAPAALGTLLVTALGAWLVARFEQHAEVRIAVVGAPAQARELARELGAIGGGHRVVGWIDRGSHRSDAGARCLGDLSELAEIVARDRIHLIVDGAGEAAAAGVANACVGLDVRLIALNRVYEDVIGHVPVTTLDSAFFQYLLHPNFRGGSPRLKRGGDAAVAGLALAALAPAVGLAALALRLAGRPAFARERRVGAGGAEFEQLRLRAGTGPFGRLLRRSRLESVPMLWNVIVGDMSLVGPRADRPGLVAELEWQMPFYDRRELIRPGLTGWAQLRSRSGERAGSSWALCHDLYYLKHRSIRLDAMILLQAMVVGGHGLRLLEPAADEALAQAN